MVWFLFMQGKLQANRNVLLQFTYGLFLASSVCGDSNKNKHRNMAQCSQLVYNMENLLLTFIFFTSASLWKSAALQTAKHMWLSKGIYFKATEHTRQLGQIEVRSCCPQKWITWISLELDLDHLLQRKLDIGFTSAQTNHAKRGNKSQFAC